MGFCTLNDVKQAHGLPASMTTYDALIQEWIDDAAALIVDATNGRTITTAGSASTRMFDAPRGRDLLIDDLSAPPTVVEVVDESGTATATITTDVLTLPLNRREPWEPITGLRMRSTVTTPPGGYIRVTGVWGFPQVPGFVKRANVETVREWLRGSQAFADSSLDGDAEFALTPSRGLPASVRRMLRPITYTVIA